MATTSFERRVDGEVDGGWLCPTRADRVRLTDSSPAVRRMRLLTGIFAGTALVAMSPWIGLAPMVPFLVCAPPLLAIDLLLRRVRRPERLVAGSILLYVAMLLVGAAETGGVRSPLLPWVAIPVVTAAARFRLTVFLTGAALTAIGLLAAVWAAAGGFPSHDPAPLIAVIALLSSLVVAQAPLLDAELRWRRDAIVDPLTGLLNRQGLQRRFRELTEQARLLDFPMSMVLFDLDCFKLLNDRYGHARGDAALKDVAYVMRKELRSFELLYRIGGEELLLVLPGGELDAACEVAEQVRHAIEQSRPGGVAVTASCGVSCASGEEIAFDPMFLTADRCLYAAKRAGRNLVACAASLEAPAVVLGLPAAVGSSPGSAVPAVPAGVPAVPGSPSMALVPVSGSARAA